MELEMVKNVFLEIDKISTLKNHMDKLVTHEIKDGVCQGDLEIDISYQDVDGNECFKSVPFSFSIELGDINATNVELKSVYVYVVEGQGISVDYTLVVSYALDEAKEVEIIQMEEPKEETTIESIQEQVAILQEELEEIKEEVKLEEPKVEEIEKIKEDISKDYENKLADSLNQRQNKIEIISSKSKQDEVDFLRFFDESVASYFSIKTLLCTSEEMLNSISKEYKIPLDTLLKGYDKENGKVTFRLNP